MKKSIRLHIKGSVQSLFYRQFVKEHADKFGVKGYFRKLDDGSVEVFLEGDSERVNEMIEITKKGPKHANIQSVDVKEERLQDFKDFRILTF